MFVGLHFFNNDNFVIFVIYYLDNWFIYLRIRFSIYANVIVDTHWMVNVTYLQVRGYKLNISAFNNEGSTVSNKAGYPLQTDSNTSFDVPWFFASLIGIKIDRMYFDPEITIHAKNNTILVIAES